MITLSTAIDSSVLLPVPNALPVLVTASVNVVVTSVS